MRFRVTGLILTSAMLLAGCSQQGTVSGRLLDQPGGQAHAGTLGVLGSLRPKADPKVIQELREQDEKQRAAQMAAIQQGAQDAGQYNNGLARLLPKVSQEPIAPPAEDIAKSGPVFSAADNSQMQQVASATPVSSNPYAMPPQPATYGGSYGSVPAPPPGALGTTLVPPPPAITLTTQAAVGSAGVNPYDTASPYANPYLNQYPVPYQQQQAAQQVASARPSGSFFGGGGRSASDDDDDKAAAVKKKLANFVPITPTGMEARSSYKQADDLKVLWKGAINSSAMREIMSDGKLAEQVNSIKVGLPGESTRGNFNVSQHQIDNLFKGSVDRRIIDNVKKVEADVAQDYYRYLYSYNKFALAEQTLSARKQESDVAGSASEQQRAAADMAQAQTEVDSARDDMRSAQSELASIAGPVAARSIIAKVSGISPSLDSLAQGSDQGGSQRSRSGANPVTSFFHFGHGGSAKDSKDTKESKQTASADSAQKNEKIASADKQKSGATKKDKEKKKDSKSRDSKSGGSSDLSPAPSSLDKADGSDATPATASASGSAQGGISFELKGVTVQPRKSILTVSIRNSGSNSYSFSPDLFSVSEGNRKLSEAALRADFDSTMVQPNGEVKGTITIFGRPWNDKLAVVLTDGSKIYQLRR